jgi:antitoxin ParD1/3/4
LYEYALRALEERENKLEALRCHLTQGAEQASAGEFVDNFIMDTLINDLDNEA